MSIDYSIRAYSPKDAMARIGVSRKTFYELLNSGALHAKKIGKRTIVLADDLDAFLESLDDYSGETKWAHKARGRSSS